MPESKQETSSLESTSFDFDSLRSTGTVRAEPLFVFQRRTKRHLPSRTGAQNLRKGLPLQAGVLYQDRRFNATKNQICFQFCHIFVKTMKNPPENGRIFQESKRLAPRMPNHAIFTAASRAIFIMLVKVVCRSAGESSSPVTRLSEMEQMARARLPV